jgi:hypothetical protein
MKRISVLLHTSLIAFSAASLLAAANWTADMKAGKPMLKTMGPITFGPDGILFVADAKSGSIVAFATEDNKEGRANGHFKVEAIDGKVASALGTTPDQVLINDVAVNPVSHSTYMAVSRGRGPEAQPVLVKVGSDGKITVVDVDTLKFSRAELPDAPVEGAAPQGNRNARPEPAITDIAFFQDRLLIAALSKEEFASTFRAIPFPFKTVANGTTVEIYHGSHGRFETRSPIRTFVPFNIGGDPTLLAAYTCTPLVQFSLSELTPGAKIKGKTIAELGNRNKPLDMIAYKKDGKDYLLMANSSRGLMKITTDNIDKTESITAPVPDKKGLAYETLSDWKGIEQLDRLDDNHAVVLRRDKDSLNLESMDLP